MNTQNTPWGRAQHTETLAPGITQVSTAGHGGIHLSAEREASMHPALRKASRWAGGNWFEEDCDWAIVAMAFPEAFDEESRLAAIESVRNSHPDAWEQFMGVTLKPGESYKRDEVNFYKEHAQSWLVVCAWGSGCSTKPGIPEGFVGVIALQGGRGLGNAPAGKLERYFLVEQDQYDKRGNFSFVCKPGFHIETGADFAIGRAVEV